ncbi:MAG: ABC transporter permease [Bacteroidota bacterium]|nr:ABC transporter permease [Bacteroidota bacterium]
MNKISIIIRREYLSRIKKKSFIIMTILGPILMAAVMIIPIWIAKMSDDTKTIQVIDESGLFYNKLPQTANLKFKYVLTDIMKAKGNFKNENFYAILYIPSAVMTTPNTIRLISDKQPALSVKSYVETAIQKELESLKLNASGIDKELLKSIETKVNISTIKLQEGREEDSSSEVSTILGSVAGILIYIFIFMFGTQVMRGVIEEKTNRIIEVIISSVKPFQLMMGKIVGIAMVGLTQFLLWIVLTFGIVNVFQQIYPELVKFKTETNTNNVLNKNKLDKSIISNADIKSSSGEQEDVKQLFKSIGKINFGVMILAFIFYFIGGYLLYASFFAAIGSAVDNEADTQQFMLPVTIPIIFSFLMTQFIISNPDGPVAFWLSVIPLTSPIIMMVRIPFGVPYFDLILSMVLLVAGFIGSTFLAAKIYRTGILMYGKKTSYKELWKWLKY